MDRSKGPARLSTPSGKPDSAHRPGLAVRRVIDQPRLDRVEVWSDSGWPHSDEKRPRDRSGVTGTSG